MSFRDMVTNVPGLCRAAAAQNVQLTYAMWQIAASILHEMPVRPLRHIMLLGVTRKVGTSFVARALAESLRFGEKRVLIIEVLSEPCEADELLRLLTEPVLPPPEQPMKLGVGGSEFMSLIAFGPENFEALTRRLAERFDLVIWDMPPVSEATPTVTAARLMDDVLLVVADAHTSRRAAAYVADTLRDNGGHMLGVVMNRVRGIRPQ